MNNWNFIIITHAISASISLFLGPFILFRRTKGDRFHKMLGYTWFTCMLYVSLSSFFIRGVAGNNFSWLHLLSIITIITLVNGIYKAGKKKRKAHRNSMIGAYSGLVGAFLGVILVPTRRIPVLAATDPALFGLITMGVFFLTLAIILLAYRIAKPRKKK
jgi:uncharacterized membrane protein